MTRISLTDTAQQLIKTHLQTGKLVIDATLGNGHDTLFLARCVGESGHVYGFDIQAQALANTQQRLQAYGLDSRVTMFQTSHAAMLNCVPTSAVGQIQAIMFNLGYRPGSDKTLITQAESTLLGLEAACVLLTELGIITVLAYPGHPGGKQELEHLNAWSLKLDRQLYQYEILLSDYHQHTAPQLFVIRKQLNLL